MKSKIDDIIKFMKEHLQRQELFNDEEYESIRNYFVLNNPKYKISGILDYSYKSIYFFIMNQENTISTLNILKITKQPVDLNNYYLNKECSDYNKYFIRSTPQESYLIQEIDISQYCSNNWVNYDSELFSFSKGQIQNLRFIENVARSRINFYEIGMQISECTNLKKIKVVFQLFNQKYNDLFNNLSNFFLTTKHLINFNNIIGKLKNIECCEFDIFDLNEKNYTLESVESIANCISSYSLKLLQLDIKMNNSSLGDKGISFVAQAISQCNQIQQLTFEFFNSKVNLLGFQSFLIGICSCSSLIKLNISFEQNDFSQNQQFLEQWNEIHQLTNLIDVSFNLTNCKLYNETCENLFRFLSSIQSIEKVHFLLQNNFLTEDGVFSAISHLARLPKLNKLLLNFNKKSIINELPQFGKALGILKHLKYLTFEKYISILDEQSAIDIGNGIGQIQNLKSLTLSLYSTCSQQDNCQQSVQLLMNGITSCKQISSLNLNFYNFFNDQGFEQLSLSLGEFPKLSQLTILNSPEYNPTIKQIESLAKSISQCKEITSLTINQQFCDDFSFHKFMNELKNTKKLNYVSLNINNRYFVQWHQARRMKRKIIRLVSFINSFNNDR